MSWKVISERLSQPEGTVLGADDLEGCNIEALVRGGHLVPVAERAPDMPDSPPYKSKKKPVDPVVEYDSADEPEEQE